MNKRFVALDDFSFWVIDERGWSTYEDVELPDDLVLRNQQASAVFNAVQGEIEALVKSTGKKR
jgi:hypothetical protein